MKIAFLTAGTGSYYCGACMRDNALARELHASGHDVTILPMYLPLMLDETALPGFADVPVFFGGINIYLQQKLALFRRAPAAIDRLLNTSGLLRWAARHSHMTSAREHGEMTLEMLAIETSGFRKEFEKLLDWLEQSGKPDMVCLSNALLAGLADELKRRLGCPVVLFFQGEDAFLDHLPEPYRSKSWSALARRLAASDMLIAPSRYYAKYMCERLGFAEGAMVVLPNGIRLDGYETAAAPPEEAAIGFLARMSRDKGLGVLVEAFVHLDRELGDRQTCLKIAGAATAGDRPFIAEMKRQIAAAGLETRVEWLPNLTREEKIGFLRSLTLFSVPAVYPEAFGLYVIEAIACGVPVVQPEWAAFPETVNETGGGMCVPPGDPAALARGWQALLRDPARRAAMSRAGRASIEREYSAHRMSERFCALTERLVRATA